MAKSNKNGSSSKAMVKAKSLRERLPSISELVRKRGAELSTRVSIQTERDPNPWTGKLDGLREGDEAEDLAELLDSQLDSVTLSEKTKEVSAPGLIAKVRSRATVSAAEMADFVRAWGCQDGEAAERVLENMEEEAPALPAPVADRTSAPALAPSGNGTQP